MAGGTSGPCGQDLAGMFLGKGGSTEGGKGKDIKAGKVGVGNSGGAKRSEIRQD